MGQSKPYRATALIVEDDPMQRNRICPLLEESEVDVIEGESAEAAGLVMERAGGSLVLMMTAGQLADRGRFPRHRRALYACGGADIGRAAEHRGGLWLHARHRAADAGRHAGIGRGAAHECPGVCRAEMVRRAVSALHGLAGAARD